MDIHPPHAPIRSMRDFLLQIFTVTIGIIIALSLEALVNWHTDAQLARVTRADFRAEISENLADLEKLKPGMQSDFQWMIAMITYGEAKLRHQDAKRPAILTQRSFATLSKSAWDTALATQAIHRLRFEEARQLASAYNKQAALNDLEDHAEHQWISMAAVGDLDTLQDQEARAALGNLRIAAAYAGSMLNAEETVIAGYKAALKVLGK
jgi:hypothetical protein